MNTTELIEYAENHVIVEAHLTLKAGGRATHFLCFESDGLHHEGIDGERQCVTPGEFLELYPDHLGDVWTVEEAGPITIAVEPETGHLLCPKCGKSLEAHFEVNAVHTAFIDRAERNASAPAYDHDLAENGAEVSFIQLSCADCDVSFPADGFTLDKAEWEAQHPAEEWKP